MSAKRGLGIGFALALALAVGWFGRGLQAPSSAPSPDTDPREGEAEGPCPLANLCWDLACSKVPGAPYRTSQRPAPASTRIRY